jgi:hypothetical protein
VNTIMMKHLSEISDLEESKGRRNDKNVPDVFILNFITVIIFSSREW